ncbi:hypothetical protein CBR_g28818 [Chara braunii]|uniref:Elongation factor P n=1 Tax=Chara braunii TaxID=69332 RepID=A0A388LA90_CHABU|nr:hypothetical protein CBR_g28818 [Chara braunii]|eukprot:GBG79103.1 hypothetical protein CBR_g28818 [Chara braunii]
MLRRLGQQFASCASFERTTGVFTVLSSVRKLPWALTGRDSAMATGAFAHTRQKLTSMITAVSDFLGEAVVTVRYDKPIAPDLKDDQVCQTDRNCFVSSCSSHERSPDVAGTNFQRGRVSPPAASSSLCSSSSSSLLSSRSLSSSSLSLSSASSSTSPSSCSALSATRLRPAQDTQGCMSLPTASLSHCRTMHEKRRTTSLPREVNEAKPSFLQSYSHRPFGEISWSSGTPCSLSVRRAGKAMLVPCPRIGLVGLSGLQCGRVVALYRNRHAVQVRGFKIAGSEVRLGNVIERNGRLVLVVKTSHTQHGRGGASIQLETRDLQNGGKRNERLRTSEEVERVRLYERHYTFLYTEGDDVVLMEPSTFEQLTVPKSMFGGKEVYLTDGMTVVITVHGEKEELLPLMAAVPSQVVLKVMDAEPYSKNQTATPTSKPAILENGLKVQVPSFVVAGDSVVINTTDNSFIRRARDGA